MEQDPLAGIVGGAVEWAVRARELAPAGVVSAPLAVTRFPIQEGLPVITLTARNVVLRW